MASPQSSSAAGVQASDSSPGQYSALPSTSTLSSALPPFLSTIPYIPSYVFARDSASRQVAREQLAPEALWAVHLGLAGSLGGFISGFYLGGRTRSYQFLAENAHRLPKTVAGWYYYHKYKNYEIAHFGFRSAARSALRFAAISAGFAAAEACVEHMIGKESWVATVAAGLGIAGTFSIANRLTLQYAKYALLFGAGSSLLVGILEDGYAWQYGESVKYAGRKRTDAFWIPGWGAIPTRQQESQQQQLDTA
ncbi:hypothetical protein DFJ77DRAFT_469375 [Powellomyces hirtus]|nr:hypothetical protein DFJ77DRAFT_469375 [Powellomyces hirtus]